MIPKFIRSLLTRSPYLIVTYGEENMRGVQIRGVRIAECLPKKNVLFLNDGQGDWLKKFNYPIIDSNFREFSSNKSVAKTLERVNPKAIIFADLPTSFPFTTELLYEANRRNIPTVIFDNLYASTQFNDRPYRFSAAMADLLVLNGPSTLDAHHSSKVKVIPPFMPPATEEKISFWQNKLSLSAQDTLITVLIYDAGTKAVVEQLIKNLHHKTRIKFLVASSEASSHFTQAGSNIFQMPFLSKEDLAAVYHLSNIIIGKKGYLQFLESILFKKIYISVGPTRGFRKAWLDPRLQEVDFHFAAFDKSLVDFISKLLTDKKLLAKTNQQINSLHDGRFYEQETIRDWITGLVYTPKSFSKKKVLLCFSDGSVNEEKLVKLIENEDAIFPIIIRKIKQGTSQHQHSPIVEITSPEENLILNSFFANILLFSSHSYHSLAQIAPWYEDLIHSIIRYLQNADEVIVYGTETPRVFHDILEHVDPEKLIFKKDN